MRKGRFGIHGGQYIPETLMNAVIELEAAYNHYKDDPTAEQAAQMAALSDGAIVGSAIIKLLEQYGNAAPGYIGEYVRTMKDGCYPLSD